MGMFDASYHLPPGATTTSTTQYQWLRAWGRNELRAAGYAGEALSGVEAALWAHAEEIAAVHPTAGRAEAYERLVRVAVVGRVGGDVGKAG